MRRQSKGIGNPRFPIRSTGPVKDIPTCEESLKEIECGARENTINSWNALRERLVLIFPTVMGR